MKIKFIKNAFGYKADQEIEVTADEAKAFGDNVTEVKVDAVAEAVKSFESQVNTIAENAAESIATKALEKVGKAFANRKPSIVVGADAAERDPQCGFKSLAHFAQDVRNGGKSEAMQKYADFYQKSTGHSVTTDADGGYTVPQVWANQIFSDLQSGDNILPRTFQIPMTVGDIMNVPADATTTIGAGMTAAWVGEGSAITPVKTATRIVTLSPYKLAILTATTEELERDSQALGAYLQQSAAYQLQYAINNAIVRGSGSKPTGFIGHAGTALQGRETANAITFKDVGKMYSRFYGDRSKAVWLANPETLEQLARMTSGNFNVFLSNGSATGALPLSIFGIPVVLSEHMSTLGSEGDLALCDFSKYLVAIKGGVDAATSMHLYFNTVENAYRWVIRLDGKPARATALTPASGQGSSAKTLSPFVVLDDLTTA